jgi:hypothetical protein
MITFPVDARVRFGSLISNNITETRYSLHQSSGQDGLRENICGLTLPHPVQNETLPEAVSYACKFWVEHICLMSKAEDSIGDHIRVLGSASFALDRGTGNFEEPRHHHSIAPNLLKWLSVCHPIYSSKVCTEQLFQKLLPGHNDLRQLVYDAHRFAQYFANTIEEHPLLIYVSALPFTPANTRIYQRFYRGITKVVSGVAKSWHRSCMLRGHEVMFIVHSHMMDLKLSRGLLTRPFEFGMQARGRDTPAAPRPFRSVTSVAFSHDGSKIVSGSETRPFEFGMQTRGRDTPTTPRP